MRPTLRLLAALLLVAAASLVSADPRLHSVAGRPQYPGTRPGDHHASRFAVGDGRDSSEWLRSRGGAPDDCFVPPRVQQLVSANTTALAAPNRVHTCWHPNPNVIRS